MRLKKQPAPEKSNLFSAFTCHRKNTDDIRQAWKKKGGFGINEVIGIAAGIIIAVVVVIPGLQGFAGDILDNLTNWWNNMASSVFATP